MPSLRQPAHPLRMLAATGCIGYGFTETALTRALDSGVEFIGADAGSMDPGPFYLGSGTPYVSEHSIERDLRLLLIAARQHDIPLIIGSAGGGGGIPHVNLTRKIVERIIQEEKLDARLAVIQAEVSHELLLDRFKKGHINSLWPDKAPLNEKTISSSTRVVAMMGVEPLQDALRQGANVIIAGRCSDSAIYAAIPLMKGYDPGLAWHLGKTIECGAAITQPKTGQDCIIGTIGTDYFLVEPAHPDKKCTPTSVAAHTMYENPSPYEFIEPSGLVNTKECTYEAVNHRIVRVQGTQFTAATTYTVKLEGVECNGWRTIAFGGIRDPILLSQIQKFCRTVQDRTRQEAITLGIDPSTYTLSIHRYGLDAVLGELEPMAHITPHEVGLLIDVVASNQNDSKTIVAKARYAAMHTEFEGRMCTAGNLAMPFSPSDISLGQSYHFNIWHTMVLQNPLEIFPIEIINLP